MQIFLMIISVLLIAVVLLQSGKAQDGGSIITGGNAELFQNMKERGLELFITRFTFVLGFLFFVTSLIMFIKG